MSSGRVDVRFRESTGKARMRFFALAEEHVENIQLALKIIREELDTDYDSVALDAMATHFLATYDGIAIPPEGDEEISL